MAITLAKKAPEWVLRYSWSPPIMSHDNVASATLQVTSGTVVLDGYGLDGDEVFFFASGGADGETAIITATATTSEGETLSETLYLPVRATAQALGQTVLDVIKYALRPIIGLRADPKPAEQADARENLDLMLSSWAESGADLGVRLPTQEADVLYLPDGYLSAIKSGLRVRLCELYGQPVSPTDMLAARRGEILVKFKNLPDERAGVYF